MAHENLQVAAKGVAGTWKTAQASLLPYMRIDTAGRNAPSISLPEA